MSGFKTKLLGGVIAISAIAVMSESVSAQAVDRYKQGIKHKRAQQITLKPRDTLKASTDETQVLPSLKGLVIINSPKQLKSRGAKATGVETRGDVVPDEVTAAAQPYVGKPVSLASLDRLTRDMVLAFRSAGIPVVNVVVPPQDVSGGVVQIIAVVGRLGKLTVEGNAPNPEYYSEGWTLSQGDVIEEGAVLDHLRWKSRRFHRRVNAIYSPGTGFSETNVTLDVKETKPWTAFIGADNTGSSKSIGNYRMFAGATIGDLWNLDHEFSYQFTTSDKGPSKLGAHVLSYILPVYGRTDFQLSGAHVNSSAIVGPGKSKGDSYQIGGTFITQLPRLGQVSWDARYGFEYKNSDNTFEFGGVVASGNKTELGQFFAQVIGQRGDSDSRTSFHAGVWLSPGKMFGNQTDAAFAGTRSDASADHLYVRAGFDHTFFLPEDWFFNIEADGQIANKRLLPSEELYLGGLNSIRGFDENALRGDNGALVRMELHTPGISLLTNITDGPKDSLRLFGFFDAGFVTVNGTKNATEGNATIAGAGIGLTYQVANNFTAEMAYGWQLDSDKLLKANGKDDNNGTFHFRILARF